MNKSKLLIGFAFLCFMLYFVFQLMENFYWSDIFRALIIPTIALLYFFSIEKKSIYFSGFLVLYSLSELLSLIYPLIPIQVDYYLGNTLYITAYILLIYEILKSMSFGYVLRNYSIHLIVLTALSAYIVSVLLKITSPYVEGLEFVVEFIYNLITLILLSVALINFLFRDTKKSLMMFFGALCIVFSEMIQIAYFYIDTNMVMTEVLNLTYSVLLIASFCFFYAQSKLERSEVLKGGVLINSETI